MQFLTYPKIRDINKSNWGDVLNDIKNHGPETSVYDDTCRITTGHEYSHYLNSLLRNKHNDSSVRYNCFYCIFDRYIVLKEPDTTIREVAQNVPQALRGNVYNLYLVQQAASWNDTPLYIFDEWMGYSNGTACGLDLAEKKLWQGRRAETVGQMLEFNIYSLCLLRVIKDKGYDENIKRFMSWNLTRTFNFYRISKQFPDFSDTKHDEYLHKFKNDPLCQFYCEQFPEVESLLNMV